VLGINDLEAIRDDLSGWRIIIVLGEASLVLPQVGHHRFSYHWSRMAERLRGFRLFVCPMPDCPFFRQQTSEE
jgi:hypothetical protein